MNKNICLILACFIISVSYGQKPKSLLKNAQSIIDDGDFSAAKEELILAEAKFEIMTEKEKAKYYYLNGLVYYANGTSNIENCAVAIENLEKAIEIEELSKTKSYTPKAENLKTNIANLLLVDGNDAFENRKDYETAYKNYKLIYKITDDTLYLYNAANSAFKANKKDLSLVLYNKLIDLGFTGITTDYYAINTETSQLTNFGFNEKGRDFYVNTLGYTDPTEKKVESVELPILRTVSRIYKDMGELDNALKYITIASNKDPNDINNIFDESLLRWEMGDFEIYRKLMTKAAEIDPNNPDLFFNLGVVASMEGDKDVAMLNYRKTIEIDSTYSLAYINMAGIMLEPADKMVEGMNELSKIMKTNADFDKYDRMKIERVNIIKKSIPLLEKVLEIDNIDLRTIDQLAKIYSEIGNEEKEAYYKSLLDKLSSN